LRRSPTGRQGPAIYAPGALALLGHGLAPHDDGDATGAGIETTLEVEFTVEVVKKKE